ncbi:MAG: 16S rRNA (cytosine(1402)-N(4))-methyltransferase RsmH [Desulfovibrionaceae bacterium]|nr:16S rRNA (cytosine(1402)-N(4))-methyltransferase RsmH [Desulfovibrionaceae bacterium]
MYPHIPVLLHEALAYLEPARGGVYLDGTLGMGGHAEAVLRAGADTLIGLDRDPQALRIAGERLAPFVRKDSASASGAQTEETALPAGKQIWLRNSPFSAFEAVLKELAPDGVDGALLDLGVSSLQLDQAERGFSFLRDGPLDMRMSAEGPLAHSTPHAMELIETASFEELRKIIAEYGEEPMAAPIARAILQARNSGIAGTADLARIVAEAYPAKWRATARRHPATRTFQALRMAVNREIQELEAFLSHIAHWLKPGGRLVIISFHSLEDRLVKQAFRDGSATCICPKSLPRCVCNIKPVYRVLTRRPLTPSSEEIAANPRAGSAKLRAAERI